MNPQEDSSAFFKQKRDSYLIDIRKKKNITQIEAKRAKLTQPDSTTTQSATDYSNVPLSELAASFMNLLQAQNLADLPNIARAIRFAVSKTEAAPIEELINTGIVPTMVSILTPQYYQETDLLAECSWAIVNIVNNSQYVETMVKLDILPLAMQLLDHPVQDVKENAIWILANITSDNTEYRDFALNNGIAKKIDQLFNDRSLREPIHHLLIWLISNLCSGRPYPDFGYVATFLIYLEDFIRNSKKERTISHCLHTLSYLTDTDDENQIEEILNMDIMDNLKLFLKAGIQRLKMPLLRIFSNITAASDDFTQRLLDLGFIELLAPLLSDEKKNVRKEVCYIFSNMLAGNSVQRNTVFAFEHGQIIEKLFHMATHDSEDVSEECILALCNASEAEGDELRFLIDLDFIQLIVELLTKTAREDIIKECIRSLRFVLEEGKEIAHGPSPQDNPYFVKLLECNGLSVIESFLMSSNVEVCHEAEELITDFAEKV